MSEGIEFLLELQANIEGATKMVRELTKVEAATYAADAALKAAEKHTTSLGRAFHKGKEWVSEFGREAAASFTGMFAAKAVFDSVKEGIHLLGDLALEALHAAGEGEQVRVAYENMLGVKPAGEMLEYFHDLAKASQFTDDQIAQLGGALTRAGYAGVEFRKAMAASLDIAALPGAGDAFSKAAEGIEIFSRIALKGGIGARELVRAGVNTQAFYKDVSEQTGLGLKAVEEQLQQGKIKVEIIRESIFRAMQKKGGKIGDADFAMSKTLLAQADKVKDIIPNLFKDLESTGGIKSITAGLGRLVEMLDPAAPSGKKIIAGLTALIDKFGKFIGEVDVDHVAHQVVVGLEAIGKAASLAGKAIDILVTSYEGWQQIIHGPKPKERLFSAVPTEQLKSELTGEALGRLPLGNTFLGKLAAGLGGMLSSGFGKGVKDGQKEVQAATGALGDAAADGMMSTLEMQSPSRVFQRFGRMSAKGYTLGVRGESGDVQSEIDQTFSPDMPVAPGLSGRALGGDVHYEANVTVNVSGGASREHADEMADSMRAQILRLFEQMAAEGAGA